MVLPRKFRDIVLCVALLGVPILFLQSNVKESSEASPIDRVILRISSPIQAAVTWAASGLHRSWRRYAYLVRVEQENESLRRKNAQQQIEIKRVQRQLVRLKRYERLLNFRTTRRIETVGVQVIGRDSSPFIRALRVQIDRGQGTLRPGLPVVTADGIVGRIGRVYGSYSDVVLAVDPKSSVDVVIQRTGGRGLLKGIDGTNRYVCRIEYLLRNEEAKVGDLVVTSGVDGVFPKDLPIGQISKVTKRTYGLYQEVEVIPVVDFSSLEEMLVILAPPPPAISQEGSGAEPARGLLP
jgi:rod shape-determining protein MreC